MVKIQEALQIILNGVSQLSTLPTSDNSLFRLTQNLIVYSLTLVQSSNPVKSVFGFLLWLSTGWLSGLISILNESLSDTYVTALAVYSFVSFIFMCVLVLIIRRIIAAVRHRKYEASRKKVLAERKELSKLRDKR